MWNNKVKLWIVPKEKEYGIMILEFNSLEFSFRYPLIVPYIQTANEYRALHTKYVDTDAVKTILVHTYTHWKR